MNPEQPAMIVAEDEVVQICQRLIRIDSQNYGDGSGPGERAAAELVMELLTEVGIEYTYIETAPRRGNVIARIPGRDSDRPALVLHGHLDVVPAIAADWSVPPLGGDIVDGMIWGRGAVDMKDMDAMIIAVVREFVRTGQRPARDIILAFFADEEAGGNDGAGFLVRERPELFAGATEAISEVGGFSVEIAGQRAYLLQSAEKSLAWLRLAADGAAGHGSAVHEDNAITTLSEGLVRIGRHTWPMHLTPTMHGLLKGVADLVGTTFDPADERAVQGLIDQLGPAKKFVGAAVRNTTNVTRLEAGYKDNVIPGGATAVVDARFLPGEEERGRQELARLAGEGVRIDPIYADHAIEADFHAPLVDRMIAVLGEHDPGAPVLPYMLSAGTDNKALARIGIAGYGFVPLQLPPDLDFTGMFHGVDERVPTQSLIFGVRVLRDLMLTC